MELERRFIEKRDFAQARRGYDPEQVDGHLRAIAEAVDQLRTSAPAATLAGTAAQRIEGIVSAAEASAREIEERAEADAAACRQQADAEAVEHVQRAEEVANGLTERATHLQRQVDELIEQLRGAADGIGDLLRGGAEGLRGEVGAMQDELASVRDKRAAAGSDPGPALDLVTREEPAQELDFDRLDLGDPAPVAAVAQGGGGQAAEGARLIALNMALSGTPREETDRYLRENFDLDGQDDLLDDVYAKAGS